MVKSSGKACEFGMFLDLSNCNQERNVNLKSCWTCIIVIGPWWTFPLQEQRVLCESSQSPVSPKASLVNWLQMAITEKLPFVVRQLGDGN